MNKKKHIIIIGLGLMISLAACNGSGMDENNNAGDAAQYDVTTNSTPIDTDTTDTIDGMDNEAMGDTSLDLNRP